MKQWQVDFTLYAWNDEINDWCEDFDFEVYDADSEEEALNQFHSQFRGMEYDVHSVKEG